MELYLIRHGQSEWQAQHTKDRDSSLTSLGMEQSCILNNYIQSSISFLNEKPVIYSSPLIRSLQTVKGLKKNYIIDSRLQEASFHVSQSLPFYENFSLYERQLSTNSQYNTFKKTLKSFLINIINMKKQKLVLIYTHGGVIKTCIRIIHDNDALCYTINNCSITRLSWFRSRWHIHSINDTSFLQPYMVT